MRADTTTNGRVWTTTIGAAALIACAGAAHADVWFDGSGAALDRPELVFDVSGQADGDASVATLVGPASRFFEAMDELFEGQNVPSAARTGAVFIPTSDGTEADAHSAAVYLPDGSAYLLASRESANVVMFDAVTRQELGAVALAGGAQSIDLTPDGLTAVTANVDGSASIIDLTTMTETAVIAYGPTDLPAAARVSPDGTRAAVLLGSLNEFSIIDIATGAEVNRVPAGTSTFSFSFNFEPPAQALSFSAFEWVDNDTLIQPATLDDNVLLVNADTGAIEATIPTLETPAEVKLTADGLTAVVVHNDSNVSDLTVIDTATGTVDRTVPTGNRTFGQLAINADGTRAAVNQQNEARVIDLVTDTPFAAQNTASVNDLLLSADGSRVLCVGFRGSVLDLATGNLLGNTNNLVSTSLGAVNPSGTDAVMFSTTFGEDVVQVNVTGSLFNIAFENSGPGIEADNARTLAVSPDGTRAAVSHAFSDVVALIDTSTQQVLGYAPIGDRAGKLAFSPDGQTIVATSRDSFFTTVIDVATLNATNVSTGRRGDFVLFSPDSAFAYIPVITSGDGVWEIDLNTLATRKVLTGNMGGVGYSFNQFSGTAISPDGGFIVTCNTFDSPASVSVIDTSTFTVVETVVLGGFPSRVVFNNASDEFYVVDRNDDLVTQVILDSGSWFPFNVYTAGDSPYELAVSDDDTTLYVINQGDDTLSIIDIQTGVTTQSVPLPDTPIGLTLGDNGATVRVATGTFTFSVGGAVGVVSEEFGELVNIDAATGALLSSVPFDSAPSELAASSDGNIVALAAPVTEGAVLFDFTPVLPCPTDTNNDNVTDLTDLLTVLANFGTPSGATQADGDNTGDGAVQLDDLLAVLAEFGNPCP